jgi:ribosome-binding protein aMBF1 (putative translation factor)
MTEAADRVPALRKAHTVYERFRRAGHPIPYHVRVLESRYQAQFRKPRPLPARWTQPPTGTALVAAAIRSAREQAAMSRPRLAAAVGVSPAAVGHWEQARRTPNVENWVQLELALGPLGIVRDPRPEPEARDAAA